MMDKTININIAGSLFQIDEEAFRILRDYLQSINNRFRNVQGGHETIDDIESRIAEIFQSNKGLAGVISRENVEAMISIIGKPEDFDINETEPETTGYTSQRKRMYRNPDDTIISGVCGGIGAYLNTDPVLFRIMFVLFTAFFGIGFFVYIALWIALPSAQTSAQKREMFGGSFHSASNKNEIIGSSAPIYNPGYNNSSRLGNAFNEVFRAVGRVCFIILRIFMIIFGVIFVLTGFLTILSFVMIFVFKFPGIFSHDGINVHLAYYTDFLSYIVSPSSAPWIIALSLIAIALPMLALIYWGVKMIFWFNARDGIFSLVGLVLWVLVIAALAMLLFNEGISFAETGRSVSHQTMTTPHDTVYIMTDHKAADLKYSKEFSLPDEDYTIYMSDSNHQLYLPARIRLNIADDNLVKVEINKRSSARTTSDAVRKAESIIYNSRISNDTIWLDEYFTMPAGSKWTADHLGIDLYMPENTILYFDDSSENLFNNAIRIHRVRGNSVTDIEYDYDTQPWELGNKFWIITENGLKESLPSLTK